MEHEHRTAKSRERSDVGAVSRIGEAAPVVSPPRLASLQELIVQAKMSVGPAHDRLEHEADVMAERVPRILRSPASTGGHIAAPQSSATRVQRAATLGTAGGKLDQDTERVVRSASRGGSSLPDESRNKMGAAFGADFGRVRVHTGQRATDLNDRIRAKAFTTGNNIFFRDGLPDSNSASGQGLLAHELTHTIQQGAASVNTAQRKIAKSTAAGTGPIADIEDAALAGDVEMRSTATLALIKAGTARTDHPWAKARIAANEGREPGSVKKYKWGVTHHNGEGNLPGVPGAGGLTEYYINKLDAEGVASDAATRAERLIVHNSTKQVFHTATHYGRDGQPPFTHLGKL